MKHLFIVNPCAGKQNMSQTIAQAVGRLGIDAEVRVTEGPRHATALAASFAASHSGGDLRVYACGGDGTLGEVAQGLLGTQAELACFPCGSGNDFVKCWPECDFHRLEALTTGTAVPIDALIVNGRVCLNVMNFGFEAEVCRTMQEVRRWPVLGGRMAYTTGIVHSLFHSRHTPCRIAVDGADWVDDDLLLGSAANGQYVGGGYRCAPRADVDDGLLEAQAVHTLGIVRFARIIGVYRRGDHLDRPDLRDLIHHRRGRTFVLQADKPVPYVVDGELESASRIEVECRHDLFRFVLPQAAGC